MLTYRMKEQEYILPDQVNAIGDEDEANRIRWLATYSSSEQIAEAARKLVKGYDGKQIQTPVGPLALPGLVFERVSLKREALVNLRQANMVRDEVLASLPAVFASVPAHKREALYAALQHVFTEKSDAWWWCQHSAQEAMADLGALVNMALRKAVR